MTHERNLRNLMAKSVFGKQQRAIRPLKSINMACNDLADVPTSVRKAPPDKVR
jgi:hypothetical protein